MENRTLKDYTIKFITVLRCLFSVLALIGVLVVLFSGLFYNDKFSSSRAENNRSTNEIDSESAVVQGFAPTHEKIESIGILLNLQGGSVTDGEVCLWLYDINGKYVASSILPISECKDGSYTDFKVNCKLVPGQQYYYSISYLNGGENKPRVMYRRQLTSGPSENNGMTYAGTILENASVVSNIHYQIPLSLTQVAVYLSFILLCMLLIFTLCQKVLPDKLLNKSFRADYVARITGTVILLGITLLGLYITLVRKTFGGAYLDLLFYGIGITLMGSYFLVVIWRTRISIGTLQSLDRGKTIKTIIQVIAIAQYILQYVKYYNSGLNYGHELHFRYMLIAMGVFMLSMFSIKEIFSRVSAIYGVMCLGISSVWMDTHQYDTDTSKLYYLSIVILLLWSIVILRTAINTWHRKVRKFNIPYALMILLTFGVMVVFRNGREWLFYQALFFGLFYLQSIRLDEMYSLMNNICRGVILSYIYMLMHALLHRPYHDNIYSRYYGPFSSIAVWGIFLALVFAILIVKLVAEWRKDNSFSHLWFYYFLLASCNVYILLSVSRTAMLSQLIVIFCIVLLIILTVLKRQMIKQFINLILLTFGITILMFPGIYTLTRTIPALVHNPEIGIYEEVPGASIYSSDRPDSPKYMNAAHMLELCFHKIMMTFDGKASIKTEHSNENGETLILSKEEADKMGNLAINDKTNGRAEIFKLYIGRLNMTGHDTMTIETTYQTYSHAHNTFIQVAYDTGIIGGILFLLRGIWAAVRALRYYLAERESSLFTLLPLIVIITFGVTGMTEWVFHMSIPTTFALMFVQMPLLSSFKVKKEI